MVAVFGVRTSLLVDSATFLVSALITRALVRARPTARAPTARAAPRGHPLSWPDLTAGLRLVFGSPALRTPMLLGWLVAFYDAPEGVVAPLCQWLGGGDLAAGLILAASALGASLGAVGLSRLVGPQRRVRWMTRIAPLAPALLILFAFQPPPWRPLWPSSRSAESSTAIRSPPTPRSCRPRLPDQRMRRSGSSRGE